MINLEQIKQEIAYFKPTQVFRFVVHWYLFNAPSLTPLLKGLGYLICNKPSPVKPLERRKY